MVLRITQYGEKVLRQRCAAVTDFGPELKNLVEDMEETMAAAEGIGLAAPQIDRAIQLAIVDVSENPESCSFVEIDGEEVGLEEVGMLAFVNPVLKFGTLREVMEEGCLSIAEVRAEVRRPIEVTMNYQDLDGGKHVLRTDRLFARAIQHEVDHLNGVLFTDRVSSVRRLRVKKQLAALASAS